MILHLRDWAFDVDLSGTMEYSAAEAAEHCTCGYCRNFYCGIDANYPCFRGFLAQFGVDAEAPEELMPLEPTVYMGSYLVKGRVLRMGKRPMRVEELSLWAEPSENGFLLCFRDMVIPWSLDESMEEVVSPANEPEFLQKMQEKWMESQENAIFL